MTASLRFKFGRKPAVHTRRTMRLALKMHAALSALGTPPSTSDDYVTPTLAQLNGSNQPIGGPWGMFLNGPDGNPNDPQLGCCTASDTGHQVMLHSANGGSIVVPSIADIESFYAATSGWNVNNSAATDNGADETTVCAYLESNGMAGVKSVATAPIDPTNVKHIKWAVQIFGAVRFGIICNQQMVEAFSSLQPWTTAAAANDPTAGGHDIPGMRYDRDYLYPVTWGGGSWPQGLQPVAWSLVANSAWLIEAHIDVFPDFVRANGTAPNGLDLDQLLADLQAIEMQEAA